MTFGEFIHFFYFHVVMKPPEPVEINAQIYISVLDDLFIKFFFNAGGHKNKMFKESFFATIVIQSKTENNDNHLQLSLTWHLFG